MMNKNQESTQAVIYSRFSPRRNAADCDSIETQEQHCTNYCIFHKLDLIGCFRDEGLSGAKCENRPGLQAAIELTIKHKATLVVYSLSRLARNVKETIDIADKLNKFHANIASTTEHFDTSTAMGKAFFQFMAIFAEMERNQISERTRDAMLHHQAGGRRMSDLPPYGWRDDPHDPKRIIPDEYEQRIIVEMVQLRKAGVSWRGIVKQLIAWDYKPRMRKKKFNDKTVYLKGVWHFGQIKTIFEREEAKTASRESS